MIIEEKLLSYLGNTLNCPVYVEKPEVAPEKYVLINKVGGSGDRFTKTSSVRIQSHDSTLYKAAQLNESVKSAMFNADALAGIISVRLNSDTEYTNQTTKVPRYQALFVVNHY